MIPYAALVANALPPNIPFAEAVEGRAHGVDLDEDYAEERLRFAGGVAYDMTSRCTTTSPTAIGSRCAGSPVAWFRSASRSGFRRRLTGRSTIYSLSTWTGGRAKNMNPFTSHSRLTIGGVRTVAVDVPMTIPLGTSAATIRSAPLLLIDLDTEEGNTGPRTCSATGRVERARSQDCWRTPPLWSKARPLRPSRWRRACSAASL